MTTPEPQVSILDRLLDLELSAITFIRDYLQLHFDGPYLNLYTLPIVIDSEERTCDSTSLKYRNALCNQIGKRVVSTEINKQQKMSIGFEDGVFFVVSLREEDRVGEEAVMFQDGTGELWDVWWPPIHELPPRTVDSFSGHADGGGSGASPDRILRSSIGSIRPRPHGRCGRTPCGWSWQNRGRAYRRLRPLPSRTGDRPTRAEPAIAAAAGSPDAR